MKGWIYWILGCFLGSITQSYLFVKWINSLEVFHFQTIDFILLSLFLFLISVVLTIPLILCLRWLFRRKGIGKHYLLSNAMFVLFFSLFYTIVFMFNLLNTNDILELITPYLLIGLCILNLYVFNIPRREQNPELLDNERRDSVISDKNKGKNSMKNLLILVPLLAPALVLGQGIASKKITSFIEDCAEQIREKKFITDTVSLFGLKARTASFYIDAFSSVHVYEKYNFDGEFIISSIRYEHLGKTYHLVNFINRSSEVEERASLKSIVVYDSIQLPIGRFIFLDNKCVIYEKLSFQDGEIHGELIKLKKGLKLNSLRFGDLESKEGQRIGVHTKYSTTDFIRSLGR